MIITTPALAVAFRLSTVLPVRKHLRPDPPSPHLMHKPSEAVTKWRRARISDWWHAGVSPAEMARRLQITPRAVQFHLAAIRTTFNSEGKTPHEENRSC